MPELHSYVNPSPIVRTHAVCFFSGPTQHRLLHSFPTRRSSDLTLGEIVSASTSQTRLPAVLLSVFAGIALLLAAVGVYGVLAYTVAQSRHEIGVRMALGAPRQRILRSFLGYGIKWAAVGGGAGLV